jgi:hypothetical protein
MSYGNNAEQTCSNARPSRRSSQDREEGQGGSKEPAKILESGQGRRSALQEIEIMKQQLRPYITDPNVTILGADREGNPVVLERWKAMNAAIDRMVKCVELQLKTVGLLGAGQQKPGDDLGQQSLTDAVMRHIAAFIIGNGTEKMANARPV